MRPSGFTLPDDNNDAVEYVVRVPDVSKQAEGQQHEAHLQDEHAGENDVADLQHVSQLLGLGEERKREGDREGEELVSLIYIPRSRAPIGRHVRAAVGCNQPISRLQIHLCSPTGAQSTVTD